MRELYALIDETARAFGPIYGPPMQQSNQAHGLQDRDWATLVMAMALDPRPISRAGLQVLQPYNAPHAQQAQLEGAASRGFLQVDSPGAWRLTENGRAAFNQALAAAHAALATIEPLPRADLQRLANLLQQAVLATVEAPLASGQTRLRASRRTDPGDDAPLAVRLDQYLTDLLMFRDDVHPAAWRPTELSGQAWEALTLVWRGEANTAATLAEQLERRGFRADDYAAALHELHSRGLVDQVDNTYSLSAAGRALREQVEDRTDELFFASWSFLKPGELDELRELLARLRDALGAYANG